MTQTEDQDRRLRQTTQTKDEDKRPPCQTKDNKYVHMK